MNRTRPSIGGILVVLGACVAASASLMHAAPVTLQSPNKAACDALTELLDRLGHRVENGGGWTFSGGEIDVKKARGTTLELDLKLLQGIDARMRGGKSINRNEAAKVAWDLMNAAQPKPLDANEKIPGGMRFALTYDETAQGTATFTRTELDAMLAANAAERRDLDDAVRQTQRAIGQAEDRLKEMNCGGAGQPPQPQPQPQPQPTGGGGGDKEPKKEDSGGSPWTGTWNHAFGTMNLETNADATSIASQIETANSFGPEIECDRVPKTFMGHITWNGEGGFDKRRWEGDVIACTHDGELEGKFSNVKKLTTATAALGTRSAGFRIKQDGSGFTGSFIIWDAGTMKAVAVIPWKGGR